MDGNWLRRWPVRWVAPVLLALFGVLAALGHHGFRSDQLLDSLWLERERNLMERLSVEQMRLEVLSGMDNGAQLRRLVTGLALHEGLDHAYLMAGDGVVQAALSRVDAGRPLSELPSLVAQELARRQLPPGQGITVWPDRRGDRLWARAPLTDGRTLAVSVDLRPSHEALLYDVRRDSAMVGVLMVGLAAVLAWLLHLIWFRRSAQLVDQLDRIARGDLSVRVASPGSDELAQIGRAIDDMVRRRTRAEAEASRMLGIVNRSPVVVIEWRNEPGWPVSFVSDAVGQWGYTPQDLLGGRFSYNDLFHPDDVQRVNEEIAGYFEHGPDTYRQTYRLRRSDGGWVHVIDDTTLTRGTDGQVIGISGMLMDVTAQRLAEAEARLQTDRVARFYALPFIGMAMTDPTTRRWLQVNDRLCEILGYPREQLLSLSWVEITHPDDLKGNLTLFDDLLADRRQHYQMTKRFIRGDGRVVHTEIDVRARRLAGGTVSEIYTTIQDITERLRAEAEVRRLGAMADNANDALLLTVDNRVEDCNPAALRLFGYPDKAALLGRTPRELSPLEQADGAYSEDVARMRLGEALAGRPQQFEWLHRRMDGSVFEAEVSLNRFSLADGRHAVIGVVRDITQRKRQESKLRASEAQLREAQRIGRMGSWMIDLTSGQVTWSEETYRIQGLDPAREEASFERFLALIHPDDRVRVERTYRESVDMGTPYETRYRIVLGDGRVRHLHVRGETEYANGQALRSVGMVLDETELVEAQAERDRLVAVLENTSDIVSMADPQGRIFYFNRAGYRLMGLRPDEPIEGVMARVHPAWAFRKVAEEGIPAALRGELWLGDTAVYNPQGQEVPMSQLIGAQRGEDGQVRFLWTILRDVSERVAAARSLEETKNMLEQGEALVGMGSWVYDSDTRDLRWSRQMFTNMGMPWAPTPPSIDAYCARIHPDDVGPVRAAIDQLVMGQDVPEVRFRTHPDLGPVRWMRRVVQKIERAAEGKGPSYVGTLLDVSDAVRVEDRLRAINEELERRVAERTDQLQEANRDLEAFTYTVSHDLKAPLRGIDGYSQLLVEDYGARLGDEGRMFVERIRKGILQMGDLISDLLDYSRMERRTMEPQALAIVPLVEKVLEDHQDDIDRQQVEVRRLLEPVTLRVDREGMAVVLRNLIGNAIKFTRDQPKPQIEVGSRVDTEHCLLWVRDNGVGFDMQYHDRIFGIFQRLHRAEDYPGTGVGLALVAKAVQRMGGRVWAESRPEEGATFFMEFPR
jgi:PAS domain S-box-containing protein